MTQVIVSVQSGDAFLAGEWEDVEVASFHASLYAKHGFFSSEGETGVHFIPPHQIIRIYLHKAEQDKDDALNTEQLKSKYVL